ncbi:hypothetical protein ACFJGW_14130 [Burkholderiaceae bacterium UC74_6]
MIALSLAVPTAQAAVLDDFKTASPWKASASEQVGAQLHREAGKLCLDYDFHGVSGYAVMRRDLPMDWPEDFALTLQLSGTGKANDVQLKLVDAGGDNVWWARRNGYAPKVGGEAWRIKRRHVSFAWGPQADHELRKTAALEVVVAAANSAEGGGAGRLCVADLQLTQLQAQQGPPPAPRLIRGAAGQLNLDLGRNRDFMGLLIQGLRASGPVSVQTSVDGQRWTQIATQSVNGQLDAFWLPESEARYLRLVGAKSMKDLQLPGPIEWTDRNSMLKAIAQQLPQGDVPRAFLGQQNYWTVVGAEGQNPALVSEDGALEPQRGGPSIEPHIRLANGDWLNWHNAVVQQSLRDGRLPMPEVTWGWPQGLTLRMETAALPDGRLLARYQLGNTGKKPLSADFGLVLRPWQVNPPQQFLNTPGGVTPVQQVEQRDGALWVDGRAFLVPAQAGQWRAAGFANGLSLDALRRASPLNAPLVDPQGMASAWWGQALITIAPGKPREFVFMLPLTSQRLDLPSSAAFDEQALHWRERLGGVKLIVPPEQQRIADTLQTALAHILLSRDGPALRPGTRSYARSWIRDGAMMVEGLARLGRLDVAREFVDWFAPYQYTSGKVPCCVDARGADPVAENDSQGELIFAIAEVWRYGHDKEWLTKMWPRVRGALLYMEQQRQSERTANNQLPERKQLFGLLPPSISHEGYSDKPAYSYWDNFWGLRGYKDAVAIAEALGHADEARQWAGWRDQFATELNASLIATAQRFKLNTLAGAADRGDVDPTSSSMALDPAQADVPQELLRNTYERYWQESETRRQGLNKSDDYTPYELRNVGALARLGWPDRAQAMLDFFFADQRPQGWNQWAEVVLRRGYREPRFLGDMPHAWVSSDYIRAALDLFAYERQPGLMVLAAGIPTAWLDHGVGVQNLNTPQGALSYELRREGKGWRLSLKRPASDSGLALRLAWNDTVMLPRASDSQGRTLVWQGRELVLPPDSSEVLLVPMGSP